MKKSLEEKCKCKDCEIPTNNFEYYVVNNDVWYAAISTEPLINKYSLLCIGCLETRLGRELKGNDFKEVPMNYLKYPVIRSERLINRLSRMSQEKLIRIQNLTVGILKESINNFQPKTKEDFQKIKNAKRLIKLIQDEK